MGKHNQPPPDYAPLARATERAAGIQESLGRDQLAFARQQYDEQAPIQRRIANQQIAAQREQLAQARDYYNYQQDTYRPLERGLVRRAQQFNTSAYQDQLAAKAAADAGVAFGQTQAANQRSMRAMGVNPNSGRFAGLQNQSSLALSANRAGAMTSARNSAEQLGYARSLDAAGLGRGLGGLSAGAYSGANSSGALAGQVSQAAGQNYVGNMAAGIGTIAQGHNTQLQGLSNILNNQTTNYINSKDTTLSDIGAIAGGFAGTAAGGKLVGKWFS